MSDLVRIARALISVSDKTGLVSFGQALAERGIEILSTGGTARALRSAGVAVRDVADHTGFPEILDGRVKTLHPLIHGGLLARRDNPDDRAAMQKHGIAPIDLLVVSLYPFETVLASGAGFDDCIENIDIGGSAMIRGAAKNHASVTVVVDQADYAAVIDDLAANDGATTAILRRHLAGMAFGRVAAYDAGIAAWLDKTTGETAPRWFTLAGTDPLPMRYGENPHQTAVLYRIGNARPGAGTARQVQGRELGYNNLNDTDAAIELVAEFERPAVAIIKHANPCGIAEADSLVVAYGNAFDCDRISAFGGIVAVNRPLDQPTAEQIVKIMTEVVVAPAIEPAARDVLAQRRTMRVLETGGMPDPAGRGRLVRTLAGGLLLQDRDDSRITADDLSVVTRRAPNAGELRDLLIAWRIAKHVKSNAIVFVKDGASVAIGAGQMSRVDSVRIAGQKARDAMESLNLPGPRTVGSAVASDAFFPFDDGLVAAAEAGATAVIQPGGSVRDSEVIAAADKYGIAMVFTGVRNFRH